MDHLSEVEQDSLVSATLHTHRSATGPALCPEDPGNQLIVNAVSEEMEQSSDAEQDSLDSTPLLTHQGASGPALCPADPRIQFITHYVSEDMEHFCTRTTAPLAPRSAR
eukprot:177291_1